jgi:predicted lipid carrier protein YhbT
MKFQRLVFNIKMLFCFQCTKMKLHVLQKCANFLPSLANCNWRQLLLIAGRG